MPDHELATTEIIEIDPHRHTKPYLCRHIFTDGHRCGSRALLHENFCYYHHAHRKPVLKRHAIKQHPDLGLKSLDDLEDRASVQLCLAEVLRRIALNSIDPRRAGLLIYGLQVASLNLPKSQPNPEPTPDIILDPTLGAIAAPEPNRDRALAPPNPDRALPTLLTDEARMEEAADILRRAAALSFPEP